jgi:hypothetical protein
VVEMLKLLNVYLNHFPKHEKYALANQIRNTAYEIYDLIAEGQKRYYKKTSLTQMDIALLFKRTIGEPMKFFYSLLDFVVFKIKLTAPLCKRLVSAFVVNLFAHRRGNRSFRRPTMVVYSRPDNIAWNTGIFFPLSSRLGHFMGGDKQVAFRVVGLFFWGRPSAIFRAIPNQVINSFNRMSLGWTRPHVTIKRGERVFPPVANSDPGGPVSFKRTGPWIGAALLHRVPNVVLWCVSQSMVFVFFLRHCGLQSNVFISNSLILNQR